MGRSVFTSWRSDLAGAAFDDGAGDDLLSWRTVGSGDSIEECFSRPSPEVEWLLRHGRYRWRDDVAEFDVIEADLCNDVLEFEVVESLRAPDGHVVLGREDRRWAIGLVQVPADDLAPFVRSQPILHDPVFVDFNSGGLEC